MCQNQTYALHKAKTKLSLADDATYYSNVRQEISLRFEIFANIGDEEDPPMLKNSWNDCLDSRGDTKSLLDLLYPK